MRLEYRRAPRRAFLLGIVALSALMAGVPGTSALEDTAGQAPPRTIERVLAADRPATPLVADGRAVIRWRDLRAGPPSPRRDWTIPPNVPVPRAHRVPADTTDQQTVPGRPVRTTGTSSPPTSASFPALPDNGVGFPPDTQGAVGPNNLMVALNFGIRIQDRSGGEISTVDNAAFWSSLGTMDAFDPRIQYDPFGGRWILTQLAFDTANRSWILVGVSQSSDPTGTWNLYRIRVDPTDATFADFPHLAFSSDRIVLQANRLMTGERFVATTYWVFDKADLFAAGAGLYGRFDAMDYTPSTALDPGASTIYAVVAVPPRWVGLAQIGGTIADPHLVTDHVLRPAPVTWGGNGSTNSLPQLGSSTGITANDSAVQNCVTRNGSVWCTHTVFLPGDPSPTRASIQWFSVSPKNGLVDQVGRVDDPHGAVSYAYSSLAVSDQNDLLVGFSRFSSTAYAAAGYAYRSSADLPGTLRDEVLLKAGEGPYLTEDPDHNRWGDFSATVIDPANPGSLWTIQEYAAAPEAGQSRWGTWWGRVPADPAAEPSNDDLADAAVIGGPDGIAFGSSRGATHEAGEPVHAGRPGAASVWYRWTAPTSGMVTFTTHGSGFDTLLAAYTGPDVADLAPAGSNDDLDSTSLTSAIHFPVAAGTSYAIAVDGYAGSRGFVRLGWSMSPPTASISRLPTWLATTMVSLHWGATPAGTVVSYDVRYRRALWNGRFGSYIVWPPTGATVATFGGLPGYTYCFSVRAHDASPAASPWTPETCTAVPLDDRSLRRSAAWQAGTGPNYFAGTFLRSQTAGATLVRTNVVARRIALVATTCRRCGSIRVYWNGALRTTVSLASPTTINSRLIWLTTFGAVRAGTLTIRVRSSGHPVIVDGIVIRRV